MRTIRVGAFLGCLGIGVLSVAGTLLADDPSGVPSARDLSVRQLQVQRRLERLEEAMRVLSERYATLSEEDPKRRILSGALERMGDDLVVAKADAARQSLTEGDLEHARRQAEDLTSSLRSILNFLSADTRREDVEARREETRQTRDEVERIAQEEETLRATAEAIREASVPSPVRAASDALREARREQEALAARTERALGSETAERAAAAEALQRLLAQHLVLQARGAADPRPQAGRAAAALGREAMRLAGAQAALQARTDAAARAAAEAVAGDPVAAQAAREAVARARTEQEALGVQASALAQAARALGESMAQEGAPEAVVAQAREAVARAATALERSASQMGSARDVLRQAQDAPLNAQEGGLASQAGAAAPAQEQAQAASQEAADEMARAAQALGSGEPGPGERASDPTGEQRQLAEQVAAASRAMAQVGSQTRSQDAGAWQQAAQAAAESAESMRDAAQARAEGAPQDAQSAGEQAAQSLRQAIDSLQEGATSSPSAADPEAAAEQEALAEKVERAARNLGDSMDEMTPEQQESARAAQQSASQAAEQMRRAAEAMKGEDLSRAPGLQQQAVEYLRQAEEGMQLLERKFLTEEDRRKLERLVAQQGEIEQRTRAVARKLQIEQELAERDAGRSAHQAAEQMNVVQGEFRKEHLDSGVWDAQRAIEYLREAARSLRRQENRYATEQAEIKLSKLQSELTKLQIDQEALRDETRTAGAPGAEGTWEEASRDDLAARQGGLAGTCDALEAELVECGSDAYAWSLHDVSASMRSAAASIREGRLDPVAVGHQEAALRMLSIMLDGLKDLLGRLEDEERNGPSPRQMAQTGDQAMRLVRALDELRPILAIEREVQASIQGAESRAAAGRDVSAPEMERLRARRASSRDLAEKWEAKFRNEVR